MDVVTVAVPELLIGWHSAANFLALSIQHELTTLLLHFTIKSSGILSIAPVITQRRLRRANRNGLIIQLRHLFLNAAITLRRHSGESHVAFPAIEHSQIQALHGPPLFQESLQVTL